MEGGQWSVRALSESAPQQVDIKGATAKSFHANGDQSTEGRRVSEGGVATTGSL